jgi:hypothetical protein
MIPRMRPALLALLVIACSKPTPPASAPARATIVDLTVGTYRIESGTLEVKAVTAEEMTFSLTFVTPTLGAHVADVQDATARRTGPDAYSYTPGADCLIRFIVRAGAIEVEQKGPCQDSAGFGAYVDVSGSYRRP